MCATSVAGNAQVVISKLLENSVLKQQSQLKAKPYKTKATEDIKILTLPFIDDFSSASVYPDPGKWSDKQAFINCTYPINPPSVGVATLDGYDETGAVYPQATLLGSFPADTLTSHDIRLDSIFSPAYKALSVKDSVYFSFFYQPGGGYGTDSTNHYIGNNPKQQDKLYLDFYTKDSLWINVWQTDGTSLNKMCPNCSKDTSDQAKNFFNTVIIPVTYPKLIEDSTLFFHANFKFRFRNQSSLADVSHPPYYTQWHIDYIRLDLNRTIQDTAIMDVCFVDPAPSLLKEYQAMPATQFVPEVLKSEIAIKVRNLSNQTYLSRYRYTITDGNGNIVNQVPAGNDANTNIYSFWTNGFKTDPNINTQPVTYTFPDIKKDGEIYTITHIFKMNATSDVNEHNDTIRFQQIFDNYFAYDDGTAEAGLGLNFENGMMAYGFKLYKADTLTAISIMFNHEQDQDESDEKFSLCVWNAANSLPKDIIYESDGLSRVVENETNGFHKYVFSKPVVLPTGDFFIGTKQTTNQFLNIGFDQNNDASAHQCYYDHQLSQWMPIFYPGALMMRPYFGIRAMVNNQPAAEISTLTTVYPNPAVSEFFISPVQGIIFRSVEIMDMSGRLIFKQRLSENEAVDVRELPKGLYLIKINTSHGPRVAKLIKS